MEYKSFEDFYKKAEEVAKRIREKYAENVITTKLVENFTDNKDCFSNGELPPTIQQALMSNTRKLQVSFSNLVKNIAKHSEIDIKMFKDVVKYISSADNQYNNKDKMIFEKIIGTDLYQIIIKTTKNKKENYLLSFYKANHKKR